MLLNKEKTVYNAWHSSRESSPSLPVEKERRRRKTGVERVDVSRGADVRGLLQGMGK